MEHHYADINGTCLHYVSAGARGPLILSVHGFPEFWYAWKAQLEDFSRDHQAVALDMRGYNLSDKQAAASQYMVLLRSQKATRVLAENDYARLVRMLRSKGGAGRDWLGDDDLEPYREAWARPGALTGGLNYYRASPLYPASPDDPQYQPPHLDPAAFTVSVPTLVIWGERDQALRPALLEGMGEVVRSLTVKRIPEGSHWVAHEYPDLVNRYIREFMDGRQVGLQPDSRRPTSG